MGPSECHFEGAGGARGGDFGEHEVDGGCAPRPRRAAGGGQDHGLGDTRGDLVRNAGFRSFTLLKPAFFMEHFVRPSFLFANGVEDRFLTVLAPDTVLSLVAMQDIGARCAPLHQSEKSSARTGLASSATGRGGQTSV